MKYIIRLCLVALFLFSLGLQSYGHDFPKQYTAAEKAETLSLLWSEVKYNFVFIDRIDFDIDSLYHAYMSKVLASKDDVEFMDLLSMFMASFGDGHTELGGYNYNFSDVYDSAPIIALNIGKRFYVNQIYVFRLFPVVLKFPNVLVQGLRLSTDIIKIHAVSG